MALHALNYLDAKVIERVASAGKMSSYRFLGTPVQNVVSMSIQADVKWVLRFTHILFVALPAFNEVDDVTRLASGRGTCVVAIPGGCTPDGCPCLHMDTGEAASAATRAAPTYWLKRMRHEMRAHQKIPKALWPAVGDNGALWDGILQASRGMEHWDVVSYDCW